MEPQRQNLKTTLPLCLGRYHISEEYGFLLPNPLKELPEYYQPWMEIANKLPYLIESHQLRACVNKQMPLLSCHLLEGHRQLRLAHLVLSAVTMGYVWQEREKQPAEVLPRSLAIPMVEVSKILGLPPILAHSDLVLTNWTKKDPKGPLEISNLETIVSLPGGESLRGFVLVTVLVEKAAVPGIKALAQAISAILQSNEDTLLKALQRLRLSIQDITRTLGQMHADFLCRMRDYMPPSHKAFIEEIHSAPSLRDHILDRGQACCLEAYNLCLEALVELRSYHIIIVTKYLITAAARARSRGASHLPEPSQALENRGTGGSVVLSFLKSVRDQTQKAILPLRD
ncbi:indoleamine 2,3-dioxygenase 2 isoform X6 [Heterocephalus glaber]|uniref:Indoleamine 2,3-dioxygenase 2 n=1 Tax=Heterocephalus glaber TaxID=10181 RepID=A0AAX6R3E8_HETGA|nr:indoleamine 2,3-dioxygenase 2 isoform X6 [Heterocephalus glaber]